MTEKQHSFYEIQSDGRWAFYVDATLIKDFLICERRFYLKHIRNLRLKGTHQFGSFPLIIGSWWSDVMEEFYNRLQSQASLQDQDLIDIATLAWHVNNVEQAALADPERYDKFGNLAGAILMLKEYRDTQYDIDKRTWKIVGTEMGFGLNKEVRVGVSPKVIVYWVGKPDLGVIENDRILPVDHKTVSKIDGRTIGKYKPGPQMPGYCFAFEEIARGLGIDRRVDRCVVNICAREKPSDKPRNGQKKPRFVRAYPNYSREEIEEWRRQMVITCERIRHCIEKDEWQWGYQSCHNIFMRDCEFLKADSSTVTARDLVLAADFQVSQPWVPYVKETKKEIEE